MKRRIVSLLLALCLVLSLAATVSADDGFITSGDWTYAYNADGHLMLTSYNGNDTHVTVPAEIDGQKVHTLGYTLSSPFSGVKETLTSVTIEPGIQTIASQVFKGCTALTAADIPDTVTHISAYAFEGCTALESIEIPGSVLQIGFSSFEYCTNLTQVILNEGTLTIGNSAFRNTGLTSITIPASVLFIDQYAVGYYGEQDNAKSLEGFAIYGYTGTEAARYARDNGTFVFYDLTGLTDVSGMCGDFAAWYFDKATGTLYIFGEEDTENYRNGPAPWVHHAPQITRVIIEEGIKNLGESTFADHYPNLREVTLPSTLKSIENSCFENCTALSQIVIPEKTIWIGGNVFRNSGLQWIVLPHSTATYGNEIYSALADCPKLSNVVFTGDAWVMDRTTFANSTLTAWYPAGNPTWTASVMQNYGGNVTWKPYDGLDFIDVLPFQFYYEPVSWAVDNGITTGATDTTFNPNGQCQRAQIVTFLWRAAGCPVVEAENPFTDVKETDFYYDAVLWAVENGITTGTSATTFSPFKTCSRAEVVTFLWRAHGKPGSNAENPFVDVKDTDFFHTAVLWAVENGITNGMDATHFGSLTVCNRAQVVTFLYRAKDIPQADPDVKYTFELKTNDPTEEIGWAYCEGTAFAAGESVVFYAEPWFGYLVEFEAEGELELYYLGACTYELIMPDHDVTLTVNFVPAQGEAHHIRTTCENGEFIALCDVDEEFNDIAKPGEFVQFHVMANEGYTLTPENITLTVGGESWNEWWFLGQVSEPDPELEMGSIFVFEAVMPDADLDVSITCTAGDTAAANTFRAPVSVK